MLEILTTILTDMHVCTMCPMPSNRIRNLNHFGASYKTIAANSESLIPTILHPPFANPPKERTLVNRTSSISQLLKQTESVLLTSNTWRKSSLRTFPSFWTSSHVVPHSKRAAPPCLASFNISCVFWIVKDSSSYTKGVRCTPASMHQIKQFS